MISVIIPLYNKSKYIKRAVDSILKQSFQKFEIIIVDDGSTDDSLDIATHISESDPRISVYSQNNAGVSSARNYGIEKSKFDYVAFLDGDDYYHNRFLESVNYIIKKHSTIEIISAAVSHSILNYEVSHFDYIEIDKRDYFKVLLRYHPLFSSSSTVIRKDLITNNKLQFDENLRFGEDTDFWNRCVKACKSANVILVLTKLACYDINDTNTSMSNKNLKPVRNTYFYKLLDTKVPEFLDGEKTFTSFYIYRYYISYYASITASGLRRDIINKIGMLDYNNLFITFLLKRVLQPWNKAYLLKFITYFRLIYSKSLKSFPVHKAYY